MHKLTVLGILTAALCLGCSTAMSTPAAEAEIVRASDAVWAAHERSDAAALAALVTEDAILMVPGYPDVVGRGAIQKVGEQMFAGLKIEDFRVQKREIQVVGNTAYELAWYSETLRPLAGPSSMVTGRYLIVWKRGGDNRWRVHRNLFNLASGSHP